jgi:hypothetical protein
MFRIEYRVQYSNMGLTESFFPPTELCIACIGIFFYRMLSKQCVINPQIRQAYYINSVSQKEKEYL